MTSRDSFNFKISMHSFAQALLQGLAVTMVSFVVLILLIPVSTAAIPNFSIFNIDYTHHQMLFRFFHENVTELINIAIILFGLALSISLFKFMLVKRTSDAYFSLGITRKKLFLTHFMAGTLLLLLGILIPFTISLVLNILAFSSLGSISLMLKCFAYLSIGYFVLSLVSFSLTALCCCLAGTISEAITFTSVLLAIPSILFYGVNCLTKHLLLGNSFGAFASSSSTQINPGLLWQFSFLNPALFFYKASKTYSSNYVRFDGYVLPKISYCLLICWFITIIAFILLSIFFLSKRKAEIADISGKNKLMGVISSYTLAFLGFCLIVNIGSDISIYGSLILGAIIFAIVYIIFELILLSNRKELRKSLFLLPPMLSSVLIIVVILMTGGLGYSKRIPNLSTIKSVEMTYVGSPNYLNAKINGVSDGKSYYIMSNYKYTTSEDIEKVANLHKSLIEQGKGNYLVNNNDFKSTFVPYDIVIKYSLQNGQTLTRYYDRTTLDELSQLLDLDNTAKVKKSMSDTIVGNGDSSQMYWAPGAFKNGYIYLSNNWYINPERVDLDASKRKQLLSCISKDVQNQSIKDRYFSLKPALGVIMFTHNTDEDSLTFSYNLENSVVYITDSFFNTINFLKENNLYQYFTNKVNLESVTFQKYDPFVGINKNYKPESQYFMGYISNDGYQFIVTKDFGKDLVIDDPSQLKELSGLLQNNYFMSTGGYLASVKIKGTDKYVYKFLPAQNAPDYVKNSIK